LIVLDTHALVWWVSGDAQISSPAKSAIEDALAKGDQVLVSAISAWVRISAIVDARFSLIVDGISF